MPPSNGQTPMWGEYYMYSVKFAALAAGNSGLQYVDSEIKLIVMVILILLRLCIIVQTIYQILKLDIVMIAQVDF
jgi:hypothetical protein